MGSVTDLKDALSVVTGAGSGIGAATAQALAGRGSHVVVLDVDTGAAETTAERCRLAGVDASAYGVDVADREAMETVAKRVVAERGVPDVLVNNAGVGLSGAFLDTPLDDWDWILGINFMGVVHGCRFFGEPMVERGSGHVVNISSLLGFVATPDQPAYCATKAAVLSLSRSLRGDWRPRGVSVSAVCPGLVDTPIFGRTRYRSDDPEGEREFAQRAARRRRYPPQKVAESIVTAVLRDQPVVAVTPETKVARLATRLLPTRTGDVLGRLRARRRAR